MVFCKRLAATLYWIAQINHPDLCRSDSGSTGLVLAHGNRPLPIQELMVLKTGRRHLTLQSTGWRRQAHRRADLAVAMLVGALAIVGTHFAGQNQPDRRKLDAGALALLAAGAAALVFRLGLVKLMEVSPALQSVPIAGSSR